MKIAFHVPRGSLLSLPESAGDRVMTRSLIEALGARGHRVELVSHLDVRDFSRGRLPVRRLVAEALSIRRRMRAFAPDAWLVHSSSVSHPDLFGWWLRTGRYVLYGAYKGKEEHVPFAWRRLFVLAQRRALARADAITVYRRASVMWLDRVGVPLDKVQVLPPAPRPWANVPSRAEARHRLGLPFDVPIILCLARFPEQSKYGKTEMVITLLRVVAELSEDVVLLLVGDDGPGRAQVDDEIARLALEPKVRFIGPTERERLLGSISNDGVPWFYAAADVYAYPHPAGEPFLSLIEAQACGRAVVTMKTESSVLIIRHGETGLLARDVEEFRAYLSGLVNDPERRSAMGRAAYENVAAHLSMEHQMDRIEALLFGSVGA
jgi:glycosyltransferase involved in cell wall biosynthesis